MNLIDAFDKKIAERLLKAPHHPVMDTLMRVSGRELIFAIIFVAWLVAGWKVLLAAAVGWIVSVVIEFIIRRPRPFKALHHKPRARYWVPTPSFPSTHTTISFACAAFAFAVSPTVGIILGILASLVAIARVYAGVHYISDVVAGMILGIAIRWWLW